MDRREVRRGIMANLAVIEVERDKLEEIAAQADVSGDPILCGELRRYVEKLTVLVDQMYEWAGN
ncbi:hypothetical protein LCGC14_2613570, partial [marine sediment metagenome]